jgi:CPA1 family monovalent cation:H+ antiporter
MELFTLSSMLVVLAAAFGYINVRYLKLPNTIGLMLITILATALLNLSSLYYPSVMDHARELVNGIDFEYVLLDVMLGFLLFAGALHTNFDQLKEYRWPILIFATLGVVVSTVIVAGISYVVFGWLALNIPFAHCMLFGALISPTDPIAVMGILRKAGVPKSLEAKIVGESLFNDGVGVVVFMTIMNVLEATGSEHGSGAGAIAWLFFSEVFGGIGLGLALGFLMYRTMKSIDDYEIEVIISLACVMGGCSLAHVWHVSAPLAMVVAGLFVGNDLIRGSAMSELTEQYVDKFWELLDVLLNILLFVLIGLEILIISFQPEYLPASACAIGIVLMARFLSLMIPVLFFKSRLNFAPYTTTIMTIGGLRGGISIALALSLSEAMNRSLILTVTYAVVVFSIAVQGLGVGPLARRLLPRSTSEHSDASAVEH